LNYWRIADEIALSAQLASVLEVSGYPKPGNVHRTADFKDATFEQFLAGSIALGSSIRSVAIKGIKAGLSEIAFNEIGIGEHILKCVLDVKRWHRNGNTHLGIAMLLTPISAAAGVVYAESSILNVEKLKRRVKSILDNTTPLDTVNLYKAIREASAGGLGSLRNTKLPDVMDENAEKTIFEKNITLMDAMKFSAEWDNIAWELSKYMKISFEIGYPTFMETYNETKCVNIAVVHTFLTILAEKPDTLIARKEGVKYTKDVTEAVKIGMEKAKEVSEKAKGILEVGGLKTEGGRRLLFKLDYELRNLGLNPGSTADLTASSIMIAVLHGFRP